MRPVDPGAEEACMDQPWRSMPMNLYEVAQQPRAVVRP
jgi:hypothetical protein